MAAPPAAVIRSAVSAIVSGRPYGEGLPRTLRPVQYTVAPASPKARAIPRPAPRVAPATTATWLVNGRAEIRPAVCARFSIELRRACGAGVLVACIGQF